MGAAKSIEGAVGNVTNTIGQGAQAAGQDIAKAVTPQPQVATPPPVSTVPVSQLPQTPVALAPQQSTPTASINQLPSQGGVVSQIGYNLSPQGIKATLQKGGNTPVIQELAGKEGPNAQAVAGMGMVGDADTGGGAFRPVKPGEVLPQGYTTRMNMATGEQMTNAPDTTQIIDPKTGQPIVKPQLPEGQNGDQFVFPSKPLTGGTPAKVAARPFIPPATPDLVPGGAMKPPTEEGLPSIGETPQAVPSATEQPIEPQAPGVPSPASNYTRTFDVTDPNIHPSAIDPHEDMMRNLEVDGSDIKTQQQKAQVNATANGYGIKGSQTQQSGLINDAIDTLAKRAKVNIAATGGTIAKSDLINEVAKGIFKVAGQHDIDPNAVMKMAEDTVNNAYARVKGVDANGSYSTEAPDQIPGVDAQDMKTQFNSDSSSTFGKDPSTWTKAQKTARPARDAVDKLLGEQYPAAKKLNNDMSDLYNAKESLRKGSNTEGTAAKKAYMDQEKATQDAANAPKKPNIGSKIIKGVGATALVGGLLMGADALSANTPIGYSSATPQNPQGNTQNGSEKQNAPNGKNSVGNTSQNITNHGQSVTQTPSNVNSLETDPTKVQLDGNGQVNPPDYTKVKNSVGQPVLVTDADFQAQGDAIRAQANADPGNKLVQSQAAQNALALKTAYDATSDFRTQYKKAQPALQQITSTLQSISPSNTPNFGDSIEANLPVIGDVGLQEVHSMFNQNYGTLLGQAKASDKMASSFGFDMNAAGANNAGTMRSRLQLEAQKIVAYLNQQAKTSGSTSLPTTPVIPPNNQGGDTGGTGQMPSTPQPLGNQIAPANPNWGKMSVTPQPIVAN